MDSIIQRTKECYVCMLTTGLEEHHCIYGEYGALRDKSEQYGLKVWLCSRHHRDSKYGVHFDKDFDDRLKEMAQRCFEIHYPDLDFVQIFGRNYIDREKDRKELEKWEKAHKRKSTKLSYHSKSTKR